MSCLTTAFSQDYIDNTIVIILFIKYRKVSQSDHLTSSGILAVTLSSISLKGTKTKYNISP